MEVALVGVGRDIGAGVGVGGAGVGASVDGVGVVGWRSRSPHGRGWIHWLISTRSCAKDGSEHEEGAYLPKSHVERKGAVENFWDHRPLRVYKAGCCSALLSVAQGIAHGTLWPIICQV